jgi:hypothetical protein
MSRGGKLAPEVNRYVRLAGLVGRAPHRLFMLGTEPHC